MPRYIEKVLAQKYQVSFHTIDTKRTQITRYLCCFAILTKFGKYCKHKRNKSKQ